MTPTRSPAAAFSLTSFSAVSASDMTMPPPAFAPVPLCDESVDVSSSLSSVSPSASAA